MLDVLITQSVARRYLAIKSKNALKLKRDNYAATVIQKNWHCFVARSDYIFTLHDIMLCQVFYFFCAFIEHILYLLNCFFVFINMWYIAATSTPFLTKSKGSAIGSNNYSKELAQVCKILLTSISISMSCFPHMYSFLIFLVPTNLNIFLKQILVILSFCYTSVIIIFCLFY